MDDLETRVKRTLEQQATRASVDSGVVGLAMRKASRRRRQTRSLGAVAACTVVVAAVAVGMIMQVGGGGGTGEIADDGTHPQIPGKWRTEYWGGLAVDVPAEWGYGGAPKHDPTGSPFTAVACYPGPSVAADGGRLAEEGGAEGYLGRPVGLTDVCAGYPFDPNGPNPRGPYVWLGADVEPGIVEYDNGIVEETVAIRGSTLTVATRDAALRQRILASARGGELCRPELELAEEIPPDRADDPTAAAAGLRVCVYQTEQPKAVTAGLTYATQLGRAELDAYREALGSAPEPEDQCPGVDLAETQWVVLESVDERGGVLRRDVVHLAGGCAGIDVDTARVVGAIETVPLSPELVEPWAVRGVSATVYAPTGGGEPEYPGLIGPQG
jgi:hypothetical protein